MVRNIVAIKKIDQIKPIPNADAIEVAVLGGWNAVVKKGEFNTGDSVLYFEIDTFLPGDHPAFESFLSRGAKKVINPDTNEEVEGHVLKTARLRGQISQGLVLPLEAFKLSPEATQEAVTALMKQLGVFKYEPPIPAGTSGEIIGAFPSEFIQKTDSERVQNLSDEFLASLDPSEWRATEKIDGTSATFIKEDGKIRIAGRNWELEPNDPNLAHANIARQYSLAQIMPEGAVIQGEIFGPSIQGNPLKVNQVQLRIFTATKPEDAPYYGSLAFDEFVAKHSVPPLDLPFPKTIEEAVEQVNGLKSTVNPKVHSEGVVWWNTKGTLYSELGHRANFKAINNKYLMKHG